MNKLKNICCGVITLLFLCSQGLFAQGISYSFGTGQLIGNGPYYYQLFVLAGTDVDGTKLGDMQIYLNYNTLAFGDSIASRGNVLVEKSVLTVGDNNGQDLYRIVNIEDHKSDRIAITIAYDWDSNPGIASELSVNRLAVCKVLIKVQNRAWTSNVSFQEDMMPGQQFLGDNFTQFFPVTATGTDDIVLSIENVENTTIPTEFKMHQNYPNPFNPETTVRFELPADLGGENVSLVVYDMLGRKVRTLQDGPLSAGTYELKWDAKTDGGVDLASGTYLLRLQAKRQQQIIKMLLMK